MNRRTRVTTTNRQCILCGGRTHPLVDDELHLTYDVCNRCLFIYKQPMYHLDWDAEKERYLQHHNEEENMGYIAYLKAFIETSIHPLDGVKSILDFGSGPYPMLQQLLQQDGYDVDAYDPFFYDDLSYTTKSYDVIILTEVLEHIFDPLKTLQDLILQLNPGGRIVIMTQFRTMSEQDFLSWWYRRDTTHVGFYHHTTFQLLAKQLSCTIENTNETDRITLRR